MKDSLKTKKGKAPAKAVRTVGHKSGRPPLYSRELADKVLKRIAGGETLSDICRSEGMPSRDTVQQWVIDNTNGFSGSYARAREIGFDVMAEECIRIADDQTRDVIVDENGIERVNSEVVQRSKLKIDTRKWLLAKLAANKYGEKQIHQHEGNVGLTALVNAAIARVEADEG